MDNLPTSVTHLIFGAEFNQPVDRLPPALVLLCTDRCFQQPIGIFYITFPLLFLLPASCPAPLFFSSFFIAIVFLCFINRVDPLNRPIFAFGLSIHTLNLQHPSFNNSSIPPKRPTYFHRETPASPEISPMQTQTTSSPSPTYTHQIKTESFSRSRLPTRRAP